MLPSAAEHINDLTTRFRCETLVQAALHRSASLEQTKKVIKNLERDGWIEVVKVLVAKPTRLHGPLATWSPGEPDLNYSSLSYRLQRRCEVPLVEQTILFATRKAAHAFGGVMPERSRPLQCGHDLMLAEIYLAIRRLDPLRANSWIGEDCFRRARCIRGFVPDALTTSRGIVTAVEYGGAYGAERLRRFKAACERLSLPFEIW